MFQRIISMNVYSMFISLFLISPVPELSACVLCPQVRCEQPGVAGGRRLHDCLHEWSNSSQEDARHQLAEEMLPDD